MAPHRVVAPVKLGPRTLGHRTAHAATFEGQMLAARVIGAS
jgi:hypothetical protein